MYPDAMILAIRIRLRQGAKQRTLAAQIGVSRGLVHAISKGHRLTGEEIAELRAVDTLPPPEGPKVRCPTCGALVHGYCMRCVLLGCIDDPSECGTKMALDKFGNGSSVNVMSSMRTNSKNRSERRKRRRRVMSALVLLIGLLAMAFPLPDWMNETTRLEWWNKLGPKATGLIAALVEQFKATGRAVLPLPDGTELILAESGKCLSYAPGIVEARLRAIPAEQWAAAVGPQAWGDGQFLELLIQLLPIIAQWLPYFLKPEPAPAPEPQVL